MKKPIKIVSVFITLIAATACLLACGDKGFDDFADYITSHGTLSSDESYYSVGVAYPSNTYSAMYYSEAGELVIGSSTKTDEYLDVLMISLTKDSQTYNLMFMRQSIANSQVIYAGHTDISPATPYCLSLTLATEGRDGEKDYSMITIVNGYLTALFPAQDTLFADAGLSMADIGFVY